MSAAILMLAASVRPSLLTTLLRWHVIIFFLDGALLQVPALNIFETSFRRGKFDESRKLSNGQLMDFKHIYPMDAVFDTPADVPEDVSAGGSVHQMQTLNACKGVNASTACRPEVCPCPSCPRLPPTSAMPATAAGPCLSAPRRWPRTLARLTSWCVLVLMMMTMCVCQIVAHTHTNIHVRYTHVI